MTLTRANVEAVLIKRCGRVLLAVDLDGTTANGTNADLNDPIWAAMRQLEYAVVSISAVADSDLANVATDDERALLDVAELRTLETAQNAASGLVDISVGPRRESLSQLASSIGQAIERKRTQVQQEYGLTGQTLDAGVFSVATAEDGTYTQTYDDFGGLTEYD